MRYSLDGQRRLGGVRLALPADPVEVVVGLQVGADRERLNRLRSAGWEVVFVTAQHLRDPHRMVCMVRAALLARQAA